MSQAYRGDRIWRYKRSWGAWVCMGKLILQMFWGLCSVRKNYIVQMFLGFVMYKESYIGLCDTCDSQKLFRAARNIEIFWEKESRNLFCWRQKSIEKHTGNGSFVLLIWEKFGRLSYPKDDVITPNITYDVLLCMKNSMCICLCICIYVYVYVCVWV